MGLFIDRDVVLGLIDAKFGGVDEFISEWSDAEPGRVGSRRLSRDRSAVYRWLSAGLPATWEVVLSFCGMLDADLVSLVDVDKSRLRERFANLRIAMQMGLNGAAAYRPVFEMLFPGPAWPSNAIANRFYGRSWCVAEFEHDGVTAANTYAALRVYPKMGVNVACPTTYHIAYRRTGARDGMFRPYGIVRRIGAKVDLISENGDFSPRVDFMGCVEFETYFGPSPVEFRIASLHPFDLRVTSPTDASGDLRFKG